MQLAPILARLIGIFAVLSLVIAPVAMPSHASAAGARATASAADKPMAHKGMTHTSMAHAGMAHIGKSGMAAPTGAQMAHAIPCCPDETRGPADDCGKSCPMALLCMAKLLPAPPLAKDFVPTRVAALVMQVPHDDMWRDLLPDPPPPEPPRS